MKLKQFFLSALCVCLVLGSLSGCSSSESRFNDDGTKVELPASRMFILNSGSFEKNNSGLAFYAPNKEVKLIEDIYKLQNGQGLGDTGQSMVYQNPYIYVVVSTSRTLVKLNSAGVEEKRISFTEEENKPRYIAYAGGKLYVTLWSNKVMRLDANTLAKEATVEVGVCPEEITVMNNKLYVANSGTPKERGTTVSEIDLATFKVSKTLTVDINPNCVLAAQGSAFVISRGNYGDIRSSLQKVNVADGTRTVLGHATHQAIYGNTLYVIDSYTDWYGTKKTTNTLYSYNIATGQLNTNTFLKNMPAELASTSVYMFKVSPVNGDFYIATSDYTTNGDIYRFDATGKFMEKFYCGGLNPNDAVFFN